MIVRWDDHSIELIVTAEELRKLKTTDYRIKEWIDKGGILHKCDWKTVDIPHNTP